MGEREYDDIATFASETFLLLSASGQGGSNSMPFQACDFLYPIYHRVHGRVPHEAALSCRLDLLVSQFHIPVQRGERKLPWYQVVQWRG